jgi:cytochrome c-type biogenesis protein CcmH
MSMLWISLTALMAATVAAVAWPFLFSRRGRSGSQASVYAAQLKEIDREESLGLVPGDDAQLARVEIKRRLAGTPSESSPSEESLMRRSDQMVLVGLAASVAIGSALIYSTVGSPAIPSAPRPRSMSAMQEQGQALSPTVDANGVASVDEMVAKLEGRLADDPEDIEGWRMLGWSRFRTGDVNGARDAYQRAVDLAPNDANTLSALGEAQVRSAGGFVNDEAVANLQKAVSLKPDDPRARFLLGLRKEQDGDAKGALDDWVALIETASPGDEWQSDVRSRIVELSQQSGIDVSARLPVLESTTTSGPTEQDVAAAQELSDTDRQAMIEGMVARLDQKMEDDPSNLDGWIRLIKARRVLGQDNIAAETLSRAKSNFSADPDALVHLNQAASEPLDIPPG